MLSVVIVIISHMRQLVVIRVRCHVVRFRFRFEYSFFLRLANAVSSTTVNGNFFSSNALSRLFVYSCSKMAPSCVLCNSVRCSSATSKMMLNVSPSFQAHAADKTVQEL
jgi:hypothetical protein